MIRLDFGDWGGGSRSFRTRAQIDTYLTQQRAEWVEDQELANLFVGGGQNTTQFRGIPDTWARLAARMQGAADQFPDLGEAFQRAVQTEVKAAPPISARSSVGEEIRDIAITEGVGPAVLALNYLRAKPNEFSLQNGTKAHLEASHRIWARVNSLDTESAKRTRSSIRRTLTELEDALAGHHEYLEEVEANKDAAYEQWAQDLEAERAQFAEYREQIAGEIVSDRKAWQGEWEEQRRLYIEQLKLKAAVTEWADRAIGHEGSFRRQRTWVVGIGLVGVVAAVLWSWGALTLAHWLFADALVQGAPTPVVGTLRPTWIHELIFAASASLLYLTMFLWTMRVLVRMMMSEHHLGVDARSRASMAHTYLALLEANGVSEDADRAIVLAALFRPVTDGLVKDDALPLFSPASILSGQLASK